MLCENEPFRVGAILSMTGVWSEFGEAEKNGIELAKFEQPEIFRGIEFIYEDCGYAGARAVSAYTKLKSADKIDLIYVWGAEPALIVAPLAEADKMPMIAAAIPGEASTGRKYVIRSLNYSEQYAAKLAQYFKSNHIARLGVLAADLSYYQYLLRGLQENLDPNQSIEVVGNVPPSYSNFQTDITKLKGKRFDAFGLFLTPSQILEAYRQMEAQHVKLQTFGGTAFQSSTLVAESNGAMEGALYSHNIVRPQFRERYLSRYGNDHQLPWAANAYDMAVLIGRQFRNQARKLSPEKVMAGLTTQREEEGEAGKFQFQKNERGGQYYEYEIAVYRIEGTKHTIVFR